MTDADGVNASTTSSGTIVHFSYWPIIVGTEEDRPHVDKLPGTIRLAILIGATGTFWSAGTALIAWLH